MLYMPRCRLADTSPVTSNYTNTIPHCNRPVSTSIDYFNRCNFE